MKNKLSDYGINGDDNSQEYSNSESAVEWFVDEINNIKSSSTNMNGKVQFLEKELYNLFDQAKELFEKQIKNSYKSGVIDGFNSRTVETKTDPQDYFNQIFGKK